MTQLGAYDAEQTNRLSDWLWGAGFPPPDEPSDDHGWSSAPVAMDGEKGPWLTGGSVHPPAMDGQVSPEPRMAGGDPVHCPAFRVGRLNGSLLFYLRKDVALVSHCALGLGRGDVWEKAHFMCAFIPPPYSLVKCSVLL